MEGRNCTVMAVALSWALVDSRNVALHSNYGNELKIETSEAALREKALRNIKVRPTPWKRW